MHAAAAHASCLLQVAHILPSPPLAVVKCYLLCALLQVKSEQLSTCARKLTVTVPGAMVQQCFHTTVDKLTKLTGRLPGVLGRG